MSQSIMKCGKCKNIFSIGIPNKYLILCRLMGMDYSGIFKAYKQGEEFADKIHEKKNYYFWTVPEDCPYCGNSKNNFSEVFRYL